MYVGALMNTAVTWLSDGERFSAEEIARYFVDVAARMRENDGQEHIERELKQTLTKLWVSAFE